MITIDIISGFPKAGKTTLIQQLVQQVYFSEKVCIIENRAGNSRPAFDSTLSGNIYHQNITSGCLCCSGTGQLEQTLSNLISDAAFDRLIIEPSGMARLCDLLPLIQKHMRNHTVSLSHILLVIDAKDFKRRMHLSEDFYVNQIRNSSLFYLTKTESLSKEALLEIKQVLLSIQPDGLFIEKNLANWTSVVSSFVPMRPVSLAPGRIISHAGTDWATFPYIS